MITPICLACQELEKKLELEKGSHFNCKADLLAALDNIEELLGMINTCQDQEFD